MKTINITAANKQFHGEIKVGEYVAFWVSDDGQDSMQMTIGSYRTAEEAEAAAEADGDDAGVEGGSYEAVLVTE